jgi:hypothetical protein
MVQQGRACANEKTHGKCFLFRNQYRDIRQKSLKHKRDPILIGDNGKRLLRSYKAEKPNLKFRTVLSVSGRHVPQYRLGLMT